MPQVPTYVLAGGASGLLTRQQIASILLALQSTNSGATAPSNPVEGMAWRDISNPAVPIDRVYRLGAWVTELADLGITATAAQINGGLFYTGTTAPSSPVEGSRWRDTTIPSAPVDKVYRLGAWVTEFADLGITVTAANVNAAGQNLAQNTFLGRVSAGTGVSEALTAAQARTALGLGAGVTGAVVSNAGWHRLPNGVIRNFGLLTLPAVGNFNAQVIGGATFYTNYYQITYALAFTTSTHSGFVQAACPSFAIQGSMAGKKANLNLSGTGSPLTGCVISYTTPVLGEVPTIHYEVIGA